MESLAGRQPMPRSLSDVMHQADAIFSHNGTRSYLSISTLCIDQQQNLLCIVSPVQSDAAAFLSSIRHYVFCTVFNFSYSFFFFC